MPSTSSSKRGARCGACRRSPVAEGTALSLRPTIFRTSRGGVTMIRLLVALLLVVGFVPNAQAGQSNAPVLALWEFDGWAMPTPQRPLGLRFALLADGRVLFAPDDPAIDALIPNQYFQAQLTPAEAQSFM